MTELRDIESEKYISLETYRKNNQSVRTPVWFIIKDDLIYVVTREQTGKIKRLKNNQQVKIAACNIKGNISGRWISGIAKILTDEQTKEVVIWRDKKYGFMAKIAKFLSKSKGNLMAISIKIN